MLGSVETCWKLMTEGGRAVNFVIKIIGQAGSYRAWCPALPGCWIKAASKEQAYERMQSAVKGYLASMDVALPRDPETMLTVEAACSAV